MAKHLKIFNWFTVILCLVVILWFLNQSKIVESMKAEQNITQVAPLNQSYFLGRYLPEEVKCDIVPTSIIEETIRSERYSKDFILALSEKGAYRKMVSETQWYSLICPKLIDLWKLRSYPNSNNIVLSFSNGFYGLIFSKDAGLTWTILYKEIEFHGALLNVDGFFYVAAVTPIECNENVSTLQEFPIHRTEPDGTTYCIRDRILFSKDEGKTWKDITGDIPTGYMFSGIYQDPDDSSKICLEGTSIRNVAFRLINLHMENYQWERIYFGDCRKPETLVHP